MQGEIDRGGRLAGRAARRVEAIERRHRFDGGVERAPAGRRSARVLKRKRREEAVAKEFQHLAAALAQRGRQGLEDLVEQFDNGKTRPAVRNGREAADIGVPQDGTNAFD